MPNNNSNQVLNIAPSPGVFVTMSDGTQEYAGTAEERQRLETIKSIENAKLQEIQQVEDNYTKGLIDGATRTRLIDEINRAYEGVTDLDDVQVNKEIIQIENSDLDQKEKDTRINDVEYKYANDYQARKQRRQEEIELEKEARQPIVSKNVNDFNKKLKDNKIEASDDINSSFQTLEISEDIIAEDAFNKQEIENARNKIKDAIALYNEGKKPENIELKRQEVASVMIDFNEGRITEVERDNKIAEIRQKYLDKEVKIEDVDPTSGSYDEEKANEIKKFYIGVTARSKTQDYIQNLIEEKDAEQVTLKDMGLTEYQEKLQDDFYPEIEKTKSNVQKNLKAINKLSELADPIVDNLKVHEDWLIENTQEKLSKEISDYQNKEYKSQEEIEEATKVIKKRISDYNYHLEKAKLYYKDLEVFKKSYDNYMDVHAKNVEKLEDLQALYKPANKFTSNITNVAAAGWTSFARQGGNLESFFFNTIMPVVPKLAEKYEFITRTDAGLEIQKSLFGGKYIFSRQGSDEGLNYLESKIKEVDMEAVKSGDIGAIAYASAKGIAEQLPLFLMMATGAPIKVASAIMATGRVGAELASTREEMERGVAVYTEGQRWGTALGMGGLQFISEYILAGQISRLGGQIMNTGVFTAGVKGYFQNLFRLGAISTLDASQESMAEGLDQLGSNFLQKYFLGQEDINILDGVGDAAINGALVSKGIKAPSFTSQILFPLISGSSQSQLNRNSSRLLEIQQLLKEPNRSQESKLELEKEANDLVNKNNEIIDYQTRKVVGIKDSEKQKLVNIETEKVKIRNAAKKINKDKSLSPEQKKSELEALTIKLREQNLKKEDIINKDRRTEEEINADYLKYVTNVRKQAEDYNKRTGKQADVVEMSGNEIAEQQLESLAYLDAEIEGYQNILSKIKDTKSEEYRVTSELLKETQQRRKDIQNADLSFGYNSRDKAGNFSMVINTDKAKETTGAALTAVHEFLHGVLFNTFKGDSKVQNNIGNALVNFISKNKGGFSETFLRRMSAYENNKEGGEELVTIMSQSILDGSLKFDAGLFEQLGDVLRRFFQRKFPNSRLGKIKFNTGRDVYNFIKDYNDSIEKGYSNPAIENMMDEGAAGKLVDGAEINFEREYFSKSVDQELSNNKDLLSQVDNFVKNPDGTKKYETKEDFQRSADLVGAWNLITNSNKLDGLIKAGIIDKGINTPQAIGEFTRSVKDKLGERLLANFDPAINESLFGWLTGRAGGAGKSIIFRAKGDVMVEYGRRPQTVSADVGVTTEAGDVVGPQIEGDVDPTLEALENEVIIAGTNIRVNKNKTDIIFLESVNAAKTKKVVDNIIEKAGVSLDKLTYNGTKKLLVQHDGGKPKSKRKPTGPLYSALQSVSNLFGVDALRIVKEQDLTGLQRLEARKFIKENAKQLIDMLPEGENRSGDATGVANTVLGNFYVKGDRISMRESGTGKGKPSQTKRDNITTKEFIEFFNKEGTKSDGAIRALITQAATISANQSIRQNAIASESDPVSKIALIGDGKSSIMFSKDSSVDTGLDKVQSKRLGNFSFELSTTNKRLALFNRLSQFSENLSAVNMVPVLNKDGKVIKETVDLSKEAVDQAVKDIYGDTFTESEQNTIADIIHKMLISKPLKFTNELGKNVVPKGIVETSSAIFERIYTTAENQDTKLASFTKTNETTTDLGKDKILINKSRSTVKTYILERVKNIKKRGKKDKKTDAEIGADIIQMLIEQAEGHVTAGRVMQGRNQLFAGNPDWITNVVSKVPGLNFKVKIDKRGATSIDLSSVTYNSESSNTRSSDTLLQNKNKRKTSIFTKLDTNLQGENIIQKRFKNYSQSGVNTIIDFIFDKLRIQERIQDSKNAAKELNDYVRFLAKRYNESKITERELQIHMATLLSNMNPTLARAATPKYIAKSLLPKNYKKMTKAQIKAYLQKTGAVYEHMQPRVAMVIHLFNQHLNNNGVTDTQVENFFNRYNIAIIPESMDNVLKDNKLVSSLAPDQTMTMEEFVRYYNSLTEKSIESLDALVNIETGEIVEATEYIDKSKNIIDNTRKEQMYFSKAVDNSRSIDENTPSVGMSTFDFDETLIIEGENFVKATGPNGDIIEVSSGQWPIKGPDLEAKGYKFDFSDFVNVRGGIEGPLLQKMKNQIKKFGVQNVFVLTARPQASDTAIQGWLKSKGISLPLKNITGLGNSTGEAKALWMLEKFSEGYNDMYFVDDALSNVKAVKNVLEQLDIKSKVVQARIMFSKDIKPTFNSILDSNAEGELDINRIIEQSTGVKAEARFSDAQAKIRGSKKGKFSFFVPPSAEDFKGLIYRFLSKGRDGERQLAFFKKALFDPFNRAYQRMNATRQQLENGYRALLKQFSSVKKNLNKDIGNGFTLDQAVRAYLFDKAGFDVPGVSKRDLDFIKKHVEGDSDIHAFATSLSTLVNQPDGYLQPTEFWLAETTASDINKINVEISRDEALQEFKQNRAKMFGEWQGNKLVGPVMNKIEAIYGTRFREALEDILYRMEYGKRRESGSNRLVNAFNNWANQSVGAIMFFNMRSALLQTISAVNYLNWSDNNPLKAGAALANFPQFIKDFTMIFNSDMLKQRRGGQQRGINEAELAATLSGSKNRVKQMLHYLLTKGFLPTQIADSFAIASGGALMYRNRVKSYLKQGLTQSQAEQRAFQDFQEITEEGQQSARPDMISQQQASPLGRYILAFKNTPMQYARLMKKAILDLGAGRGDFKTNVSKIIYYGGIQNLIFNGLQAALGSLVGDDDDEEDKTRKKERVINGMIDSVLGGLGFAGNVTVTVKNSLLEYLRQRERGWNADHTYTILQIASLSPTIGSKLRRIYTGIQTEKFNRDVIKEMGMLNIDNPAYGAIANVISGVTNLPLDRLIKKIDNIDAALTENITPVEKLALIMGWNTWDLGIEDQDIIAVENEIKEKKDAERKEKQKQKREEADKIKRKKEGLIIQKNIEDQKKKREEGVKEVQCAAITRSGKRCSNMALPGQNFCTIHTKVEQGDKEVRCKKIKSDGKRCKMMTKAKSGLCYYHD